MTTDTAPTGRTPPHNIEAEESLLGAMMLTREALQSAVAEHVRASDFYKPAHALLFEAAISLHVRGQPVDPVTVANELGPDTLNKVGGRKRILEIQAGTPASANARWYAQIVRAHARRREIISTSDALRDAAYDGGDADQLFAHISTLATTTDSRARLTSGGTFALDIDTSVPAVWGVDDRVLWAQGESLLVVGPAGVAKTTLVIQAVLARLGLFDTLLDLPIASCNRVLYMACDRPAQIRRAFRRVCTDEQRAILDERLIFWGGPPPRDFGRHPETLLSLCRDAAADCVIIDSLKDVAVGLSDDEVGAGLNIAMQHCVAEQIDVCAIHHQRKGQAGAKPKLLEDVYGSTWITAGAGSVVLLWGQPGDPIIELSHLKQPAAEIGPIQLDTDHNTGRTTVHRGDVDPLRVLRNSPSGVTASDLAAMVHERDKPTDNQRRKAKRTLDHLVTRGLAHKVDGVVGGETGTTPDRYFATTERDERGGLDFTEPTPNPDLEEPF